MERREFLKALGSYTTALVMPEILYAQNTLKFPLESIPDIDIEFDAENAAKARKVTEYVITRSKQKRLLHLSEEQRIGIEYQGVGAVMKIDERTYDVWAVIHDKNARAKMPDLLSVWMSYRDTTDKDKMITFSDGGLDGRCNFGIIPKGLSDKDEKIIFRARDRDNPTGEGLQYKDRFQKLYIETLDKLIRFYEQK